MTERFKQGLVRYYGLYTGGFILFIVVMATAEGVGVSNQWIGYTFLLATIVLYASTGFMSRTGDVAEYYVAGRRVPAIFSGMATGADWMSAASFIGLAGTLYFSGYDGLAFVMGWTGGYCLVALFLAPYLRKFGQFTIPDFLGARYEGHAARIVGVLAAILASFVHVVAQIYGVGLIASRIIGIPLEVAVYIGLAGILLCSFLGGMRAVIWSQVALYIILLVAFLAPVVMLSYKETGVPVPQLAYGKVLQQVSQKEAELLDALPEQQVRALYQQRADEAAAKLKALQGNPSAALEVQRRQAEARLAQLTASPALPREIEAATQALREFPKTPQLAEQRWRKEQAAAEAQAKRPSAHAEPFAGATPAQRDNARLNFMALTLCLMIGTAALPHILMRYYTTPSVREARESVFWSLFFIFLLYFTAPALAVFAKWEVYGKLIGVAMGNLPGWVQGWSKIGLISVEDINRDGILQLAELSMNTDAVVLALPEIAGLPYMISGLVAAGALAAALSAADGLLLTIANALSHDVYYKMMDPHASTQRRVVISRVMLLVVALVAAYVASLRPDHILFLVAAAFSIAGAAFFPALVLGVFWKRANKWGAVSGMLVGLATTVYYLSLTHPFFGGSPAHAWFGINAIAAGIFGIPAGFLTIVVVSCLTPAPAASVQDLIEQVRYPQLK